MDRKATLETLFYCCFPSSTMIWTQAIKLNGKGTILDFQLQQRQGATIIPFITEILLIATQAASLLLLLLLFVLLLLLLLNWSALEKRWGYRSPSRIYNCEKCIFKGKWEKKKKVVVTAPLGCPCARNMSMNPICLLRVFQFRDILYQVFTACEQAIHSNLSSSIFNVLQITKKKLLCFKLFWASF